MLFRSGFSLITLVLFLVVLLVVMFEPAVTMFVKFPGVKVVNDTINDADSPGFKIP